MYDNSPMKHVVTSLLCVLSVGACGPSSLENRACPEQEGESVCEGNVQLRCVSVWTRVADCAYECVAAAGGEGTVHEEAVLTSSEEWACEDSPHQLTGTIEVSAGAVLTIAPGTKITLDETASIAVGATGRLVADASSSSPILVTPTNALEGGFGRQRSGGIDLQAVEAGTVEPSVLRNVIVERGEHGVSVTNVGDRTLAPVIAGNTFRDNVNFGVLLDCSGMPDELPAYATTNQFFSNDAGDVSNCQGQPQGQPQVP
jgi:hypothetical protein